MKTDPYAILGWFVLFCVPLVMSGCSDNVFGPSSGSESHWLRQCESRSDCPTGQRCVDWRCTPDEGDVSDAGDGDLGPDGTLISPDCTDQWARCARGDDGGYECQCTYYDASRTSTGSTCESALRSCDPTSSRCSGFQGFCDRVDDASPPGVQCHCTSGEAPFRSYNDLGHDDCDSALVELCGADEPPLGYGCAATGNTVTKECEIAGKAEDDSQGALQFSCTCSITCPEDQGDVAGSIAANTCEQALERICSPNC